MKRFLYGRTTRCVKCYAIATKWAGHLIKSRDAVKAGWCQSHYPGEKNDAVNFGVFNKNMEYTEKKIKSDAVIKKFGLNINILEQ